MFSHFLSACSLWVCIFQSTDSVGSTLTYFQVPSPHSEYNVHFFLSAARTHPQTCTLVINRRGPKRGNNSHPLLGCLKKTHSVRAYVTTWGCGYIRLSCTTSHVNNKEQKRSLPAQHTYHKLTYIISYTDRRKERVKETGQRDREKGYGNETYSFNRTVELDGEGKQSGRHFGIRVI